MPKADPASSRETAVKHLFRHLGDEQALLRNPLIGPALRGGRIDTERLRERLAFAATSIREEDARRGNAERGRRQAACLVRCDLGSQSVESVARDFAISPRQLARERNAAWVRSIPYIVADAAHPAAASLTDVVLNRALALSRTGLEPAVVDIVREHASRLPPHAATFALCSLSLMQFEGGKRRDAERTYAAAVGRAPQTEPRARAELAVQLLGILLGRIDVPRAWNVDVRRAAERATLELCETQAFARTLLRLAFALFRTFVHANDYARMYAISSAIEELQPDRENLDPVKTLALHASRSISEFKQNGATFAMESHTQCALHVAISNGWTGVVAESASLLSSVHLLKATCRGEDYRETALCAISLCDDRGAIAVSYSNLALAALDTGRLPAAAAYGGRCDATGFATHPVLEHVPLIAAEVLIERGSPRGVRRARGRSYGAPTDRETFGSRPLPAASSRSDIEHRGRRRRRSPRSARPPKSPR